MDRLVSLRPQGYRIDNQVCGRTATRRGHSLPSKSAACQIPDPTVFVVRCPVLPLHFARSSSHNPTKSQATVDYEAQDEAVLAKILIPAGTADVPVGTPMMVLIEDIANAAAFKNFSADADAAGGSEPAAPPAVAAASPAPAAAAAPVPEAVVAPTVTPAPSAAGGRVIASPLAKLVSVELFVRFLM